MGQLGVVFAFIKYKKSLDSLKLNIEPNTEKII